YIDVAEELARHGLQFHVNTEIGNVTLGAVACAATKDSSLIATSRYGQISSFVTALKVVRPDGALAVISEEEDPEEMRLWRSSYGLLGVIVEVTLRVQPICALEAEHRIYSLAGFREAVPDLVRQGYGLMMYFFPFADRVVVELRRELPGVAPDSSGRWWLRNAFWRRLGPLIALFIKRISPTKGVEHALSRAFHRVMRRGMSWLVRGKRTRPNAQIIRYADDPGPVKYVFSMWSFPEERYFDILEDYFRFCHDYAARTGYRCDLPAVGYRIVQDRNALLSYTHDATVLSIDPADTGGEGWDDFLRAYNEFCSRHGGTPMLNQTKHLTREQVRKAFGERLETFARERRKRDPENRMLSSYFAEFLEPGP
ncbi:MAG: FAD-binding oxidoreductase, partial [Alphaproteobacteria bacterium]